MLVSAKEMLEKAKAGHYAVGQLNINNLEWTKAILLTAQEMNSPVILGVSEGAGKYMCGYKTIVGMVEGMIEGLGITVPVALHLDHGSYEHAYKCIEAGFSSVMFDGSHYPIEENIAKTTELARVCAEKGISLEAEVGSIGGEEDGVVGAGEVADPNECKMIADLGVTMLAAGIGNIHGKYPENWKGLSFETLDAVQQKTGTTEMYKTLPKDILICDWEYCNCVPPRDQDFEWESTRFFMDAGFDTLLCPWQVAVNCVSQGRYIWKNNGFGLLGTSWHTCFAGDFQSIFLATAVGAWNPAAGIQGMNKLHGWNRHIRAVEQDMNLEQYEDFGYNTQYQISPERFQGMVQ